MNLFIYDKRIVDFLMKLHYSMDVQQPWLNEILVMKRKTVEGRTGLPNKFDHLIGEKVHLYNNIDDYSGYVKVVNIRHYDTLESYLLAEGWQNCAPHVNSYNEALLEYSKVLTEDGIQVFSPERIKKRGGINAIIMSI